MQKMVKKRCTPSKNVQISGFFALKFTNSKKTANLMQKMVKKRCTPSKNVQISGFFAVYAFRVQKNSNLIKNDAFFVIFDTFSSESQNSTLFCQKSQIRRFFSLIFIKSTTFDPVFRKSATFDPDFH